MRQALLGGEPAELLQEPVVVPLVGRPGIGETRREDPRLAVEGVDRKAAVLGDRPMTQGQGDLAGFDLGVLRERGAVLDRTGGVGEIGQRQDPDPQGGEQFGEFLSLMTVPCPKN